MLTASGSVTLTWMHVPAPRPNVFIVHRAHVAVPVFSAQSSCGCFFEGAALHRARYASGTAIHAVKQDAGSAPQGKPPLATFHKLTFLCLPRRGRSVSLPIARAFVFLAHAWDKTCLTGSLLMQMTKYDCRCRDKGAPQDIR